MNEELQNALLSIINNTTAFVGEQAPAVVQELLTWQLVYNAVWAPASALIAWAAQKWARKIWAGANDESGKTWMRYLGDPSPPAVCSVIALWFFAMVFAIGAILDAEDVIQILIAPKVYLIEYAANLAK